MSKMYHHSFYRPISHSHSLTLSKLVVYFIGLKLIFLVEYCASKLNDKKKNKSLYLMCLKYLLKWIHNTYLNNIVMQRTAPAKCNISNNYQLSKRWYRSQCRWQPKTLHFCSSKSQSRCIFSWIAHLDAFFFDGKSIFSSN